MGNEPEYHGTQNVARWAPGQAGARPVCALGMPPDSQIRVAPNGLWRVSIAAVRSTADQADAPTLGITWGAGHASRQLDGVLLPAIIYSPGFLTVQAVLAGAASGDLQVICNVTPVGGASNDDQVFTFHDASAAAVALPPTVVSVLALEASTVTPFGAAGPIALATNSRLEVAGPVSLNTGRAYARHEL